MTRFFFAANLLDTAVLAKEYGSLSTFLAAGDCIIMVLIMVKSGANLAGCHILWFIPDVQPVDSFRSLPAAQVSPAN